MFKTKCLKANFLLSLLYVILLLPYLSYAQQEARTLQPQLTRDQSLFPLQSTGIWTEVHPLIPRVDYWGVHFANADTGWAVGEGGAIIKTTNEGQKWIWYESGVGNTLRTVYAVNNGLRVIAAGDGGIILISEDAGETWSQLSSPTTRNIWNMQMVTNEIGWMVGEGGTALKSTDGGLTWNQQPMPYPTLSYWDVSFVDSLFGYICCQTAIVLKTTNGGSNWQIQQAGDTRSLYTIYAIDTLKASAGGFAGKVVYTTDGGNNWLAAGGGLSAAEINKIKFVDDVKGFLASSGGFYKSTNAGASWVSIPDLIVSGSIPTTTNLSFPNEEEGYITGYKMLIAKTNDTGESWRRTIVNSDFINVYFKNEQEGYINSDNLIYTTKDGGIILDTMLTFPYYEISSMNAMMFTDIFTGYIGTGSLEIYKTTNSGINWYKTNINGLADTIGAISKIFYLNPNIGWATSLDGKIFKTTDGGNNWDLQFSNLYWPIFTGIFFVDSLYGWAVGAGARPYKTTDGGNNWIEQTNILNNFCDDVFFKDYLNGFILSNKFYKTSDGGLSWLQDSSFYNFGIPRFANYDTINIFLIGDKVYRTNNGGNDWTEFPELQGQGLKTTNLVSVNSGYFVGNIGLIIKYYDESIPVELINFNGRIKGSEVFLEWFTATETNNQGFYIEKSTDKIRWEVIGFVKGKGSTTEINSYNFIDNILKNEQIYYRLKQVDYDGSFLYSQIIEIKIPIPSFVLSQNFPNPANPSTDISFSIPTKTRVQINLYSVSGELVKEILNEEKVKGIYNENVDLSNLATGVYFYRMTADNGFSIVKKLILIK